MASPVEMDIPHRLGKAGVRARIDKGIGQIGSMIPGGTLVEQRWDGDTLHFTIAAMGQQIDSRLDTFEDKVHAVVDLPPVMALFANQVKIMLQSRAPKLLE